MSPDYTLAITILYKINHFNINIYVHIYALYITIICPNEPPSIITTTYHHHLSLLLASTTYNHYRPLATITDLLQSHVATTDLLLTINNRPPITTIIDNLIYESKNL